MKPTLMQRFFASEWPLRIWFSSTSLATLIYCLNAAKFSFQYLDDWHTVGTYLLIILTSVPLGFMLGVCSGVAIIGVVFNIRSIANGGPFKPGDRVQIIGGSHDGTLTHIYSGWQGASLRFDLGEEAKAKFQDIFQPTQLLKVTMQNETNLPDNRRDSIIFT